MSTNSRVRCRTRRWSNSRGVTLLETLVALGLFAVSAATMGNFLVSQIRRSANNYLYSQAYTLAEQQLEALRSLPQYTDITPGSTSTSIGSTQFTVATSVLNDTPADGLKQITVNVSWSDNFGPQNVALQTIYTQVQRN
jgi:Tfp pilus assembly protein PilV